MQSSDTFNSNPQTGVSLYWDDSELTVEPYDLSKNEYFCGKELNKPKIIKSVKMKVLLVDIKEATLATIYSDLSFKIHWEKKSGIHGKFKAGGQSAQRFARQREEAIGHWFKRLGEMIGKEQLTLGINKIYYDRFLEKSKCNVLDRVDSEYTDLSGVYQLVNSLRN